MMFTNIIVNLIRNSFIIIGVFAAMLCLNCMLTIMVLCFEPFIILFTVVFRKFSRKAYRRVKDAVYSLDMKPYEIKTVKISDAVMTEVSMLEY